MCTHLSAFAACQSLIQTDATIFEEEGAILALVLASAHAKLLCFLLFEG